MDIPELRLYVAQNFATKDEVAGVIRRVDNQGLNMVQLQEQMKQTNVTLSEVRDTLQWIARLVLGGLISAGLLAAAYFIVMQAGMLGGS